VFKEVEYSYNVVNKTYENLSLEDIVSGKKAKLLSFDIQIDNNIGLPPIIRKYGNVEAQFGEEDPEANAILQASDQMKSSGDFYQGNSYPAQGEAFEYESDESIEGSVNSLNDDENVTQTDEVTQTTPINPNTGLSPVEETESIGQLNQSPTLDEELVENSTGLNIEISPIELPESNQINQLSESSVSNISNNTSVSDSNLTSVDSLSNIFNETSYLSTLINSFENSSAINENSLIKSQIANNSESSDLNNFINAIDLNKSNSSVLYSDVINNSLSSRDELNSLDLTDNKYTLSSSSVSKVNPSSLEPERVIKSMSENIGVSRDVLSMKEDNFTFASTYDNSKNTSIDSNSNSSSESTDSSESSNTSNSSIKMTEVSNTNNSPSSNNSSTNNESNVRSYSNIDLSVLESRLKKIERILSGPLDVKIID
jgi:hypothetical protein